MRSVLIVEDEPLISLMLEEMVETLGWAIAASVQTENAALSAIETLPPTVAILDIELATTSSLTVAKACMGRGVPVVFSTGYSASEVPAECANSPILTKPFSVEELEDCLNRALAQVPAVE